MGKSTFLGVEIAPAEQQRRTALVLLGLLVIVGAGAPVAFMLPELIRHYKHVPAEGRITAIETKCHYQVHRLGKRGPAQVTDLVDCHEARRIAAEVDHAMGEVREVAIVKVDYTIADGSPGSSWLDLPAGAAADLVVGQPITIGYDPEYPHRVHRRASNPFALTHEGRFGITRGARPAGSEVAPAEATRAAPVVEPVSPRPQPSEAIKTFSWYAARIIVLAMLIGMLWGVRATWRLVSRSLGGGSVARSAAKPDRGDIAAARIARATRQATHRPSKDFARR